MKQILDQFEDIKIGSIDGEGAHRVLLIMFVMTLHSVSEGVGIGVSFGENLSISCFSLTNNTSLPGGVHGNQLGKFISLSLAMHNIPEGLAVALVLTSRGISKLRTGELLQPILHPFHLFVSNSSFSQLFGVSLHLFHSPSWRSPHISLLNISNHCCRLA
jgi:hypothetical protein